MPFADLSDDDLVAIVSYLRTQPAVRREVVGRELNPLGHVVAAFVLEPPAPTKPPLATAPTGPSAERGRYLAESVANCAGCHTARDLRTGAFVGPRFAGGMTFTSKQDGKTVLVSPNLTPDPATGRIASWNEEVFVARFRTGRGAEGTHMPWSSFARMTDDDLRSLWRFLASLSPVRNDTGPSVRAPTVASAD
jgi:mono/diheme cytochrome c family protein